MVICIEVVKVVVQVASLALRKAPSRTIEGGTTPRASSLSRGWSAILFFANAVAESGIDVGRKERAVQVYDES